MTPVFRQQSAELFLRPMKPQLIPLFLLLACTCSGAAGADNLVRDGDFKSLASWQRNVHLAQAGKVVVQPAEKAVSITSPVIDLDGSLFQDIPTDGHPWMAWSVRTKGGVMMRASLGLVALDRTGRVLDIDTPTKIQGTRWTSHQGTMRMPPGTTTLRVLLTVLDGTCSLPTCRCARRRRRCGRLRARGCRRDRALG
jgi:hypothetical protein